MNSLIAVDSSAGENAGTGFRTGISPRRLRSVDTVALRKSEGMVLGPDGRIAAWPITAIVERDGEMVAVGPRISPAHPLNPRNLDPGTFGLLLKAVRTLAAAGFPLGGFQPRFFIVLVGGGLLAAPPLLAETIRETAPDGDGPESWGHWNHPDHRGERAWSFTLGVITWTALTGRDPFENEEGEDRRERMRRGILNLSVPAAAGVTEPVRKVLAAALTGSTDRFPGIAEWEKLAEVWMKAGLTGSLSEDQSEALRAKAAEGEKRIRRRLTAARRFRRSGWKYLAAAAAVFALAILGAGPVKKALEPPVTAGMTPLEVTETYYRAIDAMDSDTMNDCLARGTGNNDVRMVETLYVAGRVKAGYDGGESSVSAAEWLEAGRPPLPEGVYPWGITDLNINVLDDGRIEAAYRLWLPDPNKTGEERRDILVFAKTRLSWEITSIERVSPD